MEKDMIFLGSTGITDTKASRVADMSKLAYTSIETEIANIKFVNEKVETINGTYAKDLSFGVKSLDDIPEKIEKIGQLKALNAWLREAIKAHQNVIKETEQITLGMYAADNDITIPKCPEYPHAITEDDVIAQFDVKKRNRYFTLEAHAATIGQCIHKGSSIDAARKQMYDKMSNPRKATGSGNDTLIYSYEPSVKTDEMEDMFYKLQQMQAKYQSELNALKSEIKSRITNDEIDKSAEYRKAYDEYDSVMSKIKNEFREWHTQKKKEVASYKIIIPNSLKEIYEDISNRGV